MRIYLDVCCLNRPFNDQAQQRIRLEAEAVRAILARIHAEEWVWISSSAVRYELLQTPDPDRRSKLSNLTLAASEVLPSSPAVLNRASDLVRQGFPPIDALHLSFAEQGSCDILFTTDDRFAGRCVRLSPSSRVRVVNPAAWILEAGDGR